MAAVQPSAIGVLNQRKNLTKRDTYVQNVYNYKRQGGLVHITSRKNSSKEEHFGTPRDVPRDLLAPWLLLLLRNWSTHGYQLMQMLTISGLTAFDPATVYRALRRLEEEGLVMSDWETGDTGPAKRVYSLTEAGEKFLQTWTSTLRQYQSLLDRFFELYEEAKQTSHPGKAKKPSVSSTAAKGS